MNLNQREQNLLIKTLEEKLELFPYNEESRKLLNKLKNQKLNKNPNLNSKEKKAIEKIIKSFYKAGLIPSPSGTHIDNNDMRASAEYFCLSNKIVEYTKNFYELIKKGTLNNYENFEEIALCYVRDVLKILREQEKIVKSQQSEFRKRIDI